MRYAANLNVGDSFINITNAGTQNNAGALTNVCANVYAFSADEQLVACCSCNVTPNALVSLSAVHDLLPNTLTPSRPDALVIKLVTTSGVTCNAANLPIDNLAAGLRAWGTTIHAAPVTPATGDGETSAAQIAQVISYQVTETPFSSPILSSAEQTRFAAYCGFIQAAGSGFGICRSCRLGGQGAVGQ